MKRFLKKLSVREIARRGGFNLPSFFLNQRKKRPISFYRTLFLLTLCLALSACGGGSGSESGSEPTVTEEVATGSQSISFLEKIPNSNVANANPEKITLSISHLTYANSTSQFLIDCDRPMLKKTLRKLQDSIQGFDQITQHIVDCQLEENTAYSINLRETDATRGEFEGSHEFSTGTVNSRLLNIQDTVVLQREDIAELFVSYINGALITKTEMPPLIQDLILQPVIGVADQFWSTLVNPTPIYDVVSESVSYESQDPFGNPSADLKGLISYPVVGADNNFTPRSQMILLSHATGSSPSELNPEDAWFIIANHLASRGYLVIAPDNYGNNPNSLEAETYLLGFQTAINTLDLLRLGLESYPSIYNGNQITLIGYSQGGHSAVAVLSLAPLKFADLEFSQSFIGGGPLNLYSTFKGVIENLDGGCEEAEYCEMIDTSTSEPFATGRILPGFLQYADTGLIIDDLIENDRLKRDFIDKFLEMDPAYEKLKGLLEVNSFTNVKNPDTFFAPNTKVNFYHSEFDRLVPVANTQEFVELFSEHINLNFDTSQCNSNSFEFISESVDKAGIVHTLCALNVFDSIMKELR